MKQLLKQKTEKMNQVKKNNLEVYTDGGCRPTNPGPGACAFYYVNDNNFNKNNEPITQFKKETTNNEMELRAAFNALSFYPVHVRLTGLHEEIIIYTDSQYLQKGMMEWVYGWEKRNWKTSTKQDVKNLDLWKALHSIRIQIEKIGTKVTFKWVKAHDGNEFNELVDKACTQCINENK
jgi:ribonuclease HI